MVAVIAAILNLLIPGVGTMITACAGTGVVSKTQIAVGLLQFLTTYVLIGWIWSIYWGYLIVQKAWGKSQATQQPGIGAAYSGNNPV